jgi:hypothetical protein
MSTTTRKAVDVHDTKAQQSTITTFITIHFTVQKGNLNNALIAASRRLSKEKATMSVAAQQQHHDKHTTETNLQWRTTMTSRIATTNKEDLSSNSAQDAATIIPPLPVHNRKTPGTDFVVDGFQYAKEYV